MQVTVRRPVGIARLNALRHVAALIAITAATACASDGASSTAPESASMVDGVVTERDTLAPVPLTLRTYDGSGESVHPDFVAPGPTWGKGFSYLVTTPYPGGVDKHEDPSLYASTDNESWDAAPGAPFPLVKPKAGFLSDPDAVFDPDRNQLLVFYRHAISKKQDNIQLITSTDGTVWSEPSRLLSGGFTSILSPSVVRRSSGVWMMWSVNASGGCHGKSTLVQLRRSANGVTWSAPESVSLPLPAGAYAWHIDVQWIPTRNEYWALFPVKSPGNCATRQLMIATSRDGVSWAVADKPVLKAGAIREFEQVVYRSTFSYEPVTDEISFWFSGARQVGKRRVWSLATQRRTRADVFAVGPRAPMEALTAKAGDLSTFDPP